MENKSKLFIIPLIILAVSCPSTQPGTVQETPPTAESSSGPVRQPQTPPPAEVFNPSTVTQQQYNTTMEEVRRFIENLNRIISSRNYASWRSFLSTEYFNEISSPAYLQQVSEQPAMKTRGIVLRTAEDYFINVVVPSRANSRVDAIEFLSQTRVKAYTVNRTSAGAEQRLVLYDLERAGNSWIIVN
jgi:hypothetical protein